MMNAERLIEFAERFNELGWAVQAQVDDVLNNRLTEINPSAVDAMRTLMGYCEELDDAIQAARDFCREQSEQEGDTR